MDFLNKKPWHPGSSRNRKRVFLAEERQKEQDRKHKEQQCLLEKERREFPEKGHDGSERVKFLYTEPPGYNTATNQKDSPKTKSPERVPAQRSQLLDGILARTAADSHSHAIRELYESSFVFNQFPNEETEQHAYELALMTDASQRSQACKEYEKRKAGLTKRLKKAEREKDRKKKVKEAKQLLQKYISSRSQSLS